MTLWLVVQYILSVERLPIYWVSFIHHIISSTILGCKLDCLSSNMYPYTLKVDFDGIIDIEGVSRSHFMVESIKLVTWCTFHQTRISNVSSSWFIIFGYLSMLI